MEGMIGAFEQVQRRRAAQAAGGVQVDHAELHTAFKGGINVLDPEASTMDRIGHGTHVAGTIAADNNRLGIVGVAPTVRLWAVKAFGDNGKGTMEDVLKGLDWVVAKKKAEGGRWIVASTHGGDEVVRAQPFDAIELALERWWLDEPAGAMV